ncbi:MAG: hypothetical protein WC223_13420 [Bacteroidales bacterium]|jgi:hypothetical protein
MSAEKKHKKGKVKKTTIPYKEFVARIKSQIILGMLKIRDDVLLEKVNLAHQQYKKELKEFLNSPIDIEKIIEKAHSRINSEKGSS